MANEKQEFNAWAWPNKGGNINFPEISKLLSSNSRAGVCFSGGGNRALAATIGQLRGLLELQLLDNFDYLSAVSGGSWAATVFTYAPILPTALLGASLGQPQRLSLEKLQMIRPDFLGNCATKNIISEFNSNLHKFPKEQVWAHTVGEIFLEPYQLNDDKFPSYDELTVDAIVEKNSGLFTKEMFYQTARSKPYLIVNGTLIYPELLLFKQRRMLFEYTPLYLGIYSQHQVSLLNCLNKLYHRKFGQGYIAPYAFNTSVPIKSELQGSIQSLQLTAPTPRFSLRDMIASSSAFYAAVLDNFITTKNFSPTFEYWPVKFDQYQSRDAGRYSIGDGAFLDNYGLLSLLLRQVKRIVVFINTDTIFDSPHKNKFGEWVGIDSYLPPLFGLHSTFWCTTHGKPLTQVFDSDLFCVGDNSLIQQFMHNQQLQKSLIAEETYQVRDNPWIGIQSQLPNGEPYEVTMLWVYNARVPAWEKQLSQELQAEIAKGANGAFPHFPYYPTFGDEFNLKKPSTWHDLGGLSMAQVNLLTELSYWTVTQHADHFKRLFANT